MRGEVATHQRLGASSRAGAARAKRPFQAPVKVASMRTQGTAGGTWPSSTVVATAGLTVQSTMAVGLLASQIPPRSWRRSTRRPIESPTVTLLQRTTGTVRKGTVACTKRPGRETLLATLADHAGWVAPGSRTTGSR